MKQLAGIMVSWLIRHEAIEKNQRELYEYAVHCLFLEMMPMLYAVIIGGIMGELSRSMVLVLPFMIIRKYSGGFHARSEWTCLVSSCLLLYCSIRAAVHVHNSIWFDFSVCLAIVWLVIFSPVDSENRRLENDEKIVRKKEVIVILILFMMVYIGLLLIAKSNYAICIGLGIILTAGLQVPCIVAIVFSKITKLYIRKRL